MKKIMTGVVALCALFIGGGSVFGACEYVQKDTAWVYKWKFTGKTTYGKPMKFAGGSCGYNGGDDCKSIRCKASLVIEGYTWICSPGCGSDGFEAVSEVNEVFWHKKPIKASLAGGVTTEICHIIGKNAKECEVGGTAKFEQFCQGDVPGGIYDFTYAGLGKYDKKNNRIKSASGNFSGVLKNPSYITDCSASPCGYWDCGTIQLICDESPSVVYGKWSVKLKKDASKKYAKKGTLPKYPAWAKHMNQDS